MMLCNIRASVELLQASFQAKGLLLSRNNEALLITLNGVMGGIDACQGKDSGIKRWQKVICSDRVMYVYITKQKA